MALSTVMTGALSASSGCLWLPCWRAAPWCSSLAAAAERADLAYSKLRP